MGDRSWAASGHRAQLPERRALSGPGSASDGAGSGRRGH